ncbi:hypothetical protein AOLI_G00224430 [Acnodon oligacanthus]
MSSSITCCSALEEPVPVRLDQAVQSSYRSSVHGLRSDAVVRRAATARRKREFTPEEQKDDTYWLKRSRNNESAKRSRLRRRMEECLLEARAVELLRENENLKAALSAIHYHNIGLRTRVDGMAASPVGQGLPRDAYMTSLADFSAPLSGTDGRTLYTFASRGQVQRLDPSYDPGRENCSAPDVLTAGVMDTFHLRDRGVGCRLGMPAYRDGNCPSNMCVPAAYEVCRREEMQSHGGQTMSSYPGPASLGDVVVPHDPRLTSGEPGCGATNIQVHGPYAGGSGPVFTQTEETGKEPKRASVVPLLPHKLRYKLTEPGWIKGPQGTKSPPGTLNRHPCHP